MNRWFAAAAMAVALGAAICEAENTKCSIHYFGHGREKRKLAVLDLVVADSSQIDLSFCRPPPPPPRRFLSRLFPSRRFHSLSQGQIDQLQTSLIQFFFQVRKDPAKIVVERLVIPPSELSEALTFERPLEVLGPGPGRTTKAIKMHEQVGALVRSLLYNNIGWFYWEGSGPESVKVFARDTETQAPVIGNTKRWLWLKEASDEFYEFLTELNKVRHLLLDNTKLVTFKELVSQAERLLKELSDALPREEGNAKPQMQHLDTLTRLVGSYNAALAKGGHNAAEEVRTKEDEILKEAKEKCYNADSPTVVGMAMRLLLEKVEQEAKKFEDAQPGRIAGGSIGSKQQRKKQRKQRNRSK